MRILKFFLIILLAFSLTKPISADNFEVLQPKHQNVLSALTKRDYVLVENEIKLIQNKDLELFRINNYEYLLGRVQEKRNDFASAIKSYNSLISQNSLLGEYARWHLALIAREQKDLSLEREHLRKLISQFPDSLLKPTAERRLADINLNNGNLDSALQYFRARASKTTPLGREALGQVGLIYLQQKQNQAARAVFEQLLSGSKDDQALLAAKKLDELDRIEKRTVTETELLTRGRVYLHNRDSQDTISLYQQLLEQFPSSNSLAEALFSIGRSYYIDYDYVNALKWYDRVYKEFPNTKQAELGLYQGGHAYQNTGKYQDAIARYQKLINEYPNSNSVDGAHLNIIDSYRSAGKLNDAIEWCKRTNKRFSSDVTGVTALFNQAKVYLTSEDYNQALGIFTELKSQNLSRNAPGATNRAEVEFMRVFCLEKLGRSEEAIEGYLAFQIDRNNYYSHRATARLEILKRDNKTKNIVNAKFKVYLENAQKDLSSGNYVLAKNSLNQALRLSDSRNSQELIEMLKECYSNLPSYKKFLSYNIDFAGRKLITSRNQTSRSHRALADELIFLGLYDEGALELRASNGAKDLASNSLENESLEKCIEPTFSKENSNLVDISLKEKRSKINRSTSTLISSYSMAVYLNRGSHAFAAINYGEGNFASTLPADFKLELLDRNIAELIYPAPYRDEMSTSGQAQNVDPRFMLAIARQESRFDVTAKSFAAARGMFQFIPSTADTIGSELKISSFNQNDLYLPPVAINFAGKYMGNLFAEFKNNPYAVAASYNGGEAAVRRWVARSQSNEVDRFVIEVGFQESKDYVYKVMNNYWAYNQLYKEDLTPNIK
ncbi:MAG: tetratricopeptide repeat protein [Acidobacteria bacterium]|nr:tetratricopeptide repeat protein [Acidobacteriota bacterium]